MESLVQTGNTAVTTVSEFLKRRIHERIGFEGEVIVIPNSNLSKKVPSDDLQKNWSIY